MISRVSFRNFLVMLAVLPSSVSAFNPANKPSFPITTDATNGGLKAATIDNGNDNKDAWSSLTQMIHSKIEEQGGDSLSEETKDEIIATAVAGSVLGTVVGSPLVVGAALGFAGSQMLQGENGEKAREVIGQASKEMMNQANSAIDFTKKELEHEKDLSKVSAKILVAIQDKAGEIQTDFRHSPALMAEKLKESVMHTVESEEFKALPKRSLNAFMAFMESDEVKKMSTGAMKVLKDGLQSEELKALQSRASLAVQDGVDSASSNEVKKMSTGAMKALKDGLRSEAMNAMQSRASQAVKDGMDSATSNEVKKMSSGAMKALKDGLKSEAKSTMQSRASRAVTDGIDSISSKITKA